MARLVLLALCLLRCAQARTVWWEWFDSAAECESAGKYDESKHKDWTYERECLLASDLAKGDPFRRTAEAAFPDLESSFQLHCNDSSGNGVTWYEKADSVVATYWEGAGCTGRRLLSVALATDECPALRVRTQLLHNNASVSISVLQNAVSRARVHCTICTWIFFREDPPPYVFVMLGILVFLIVCLSVNLLLQDRLNRMVRDRRRIAPFLFGHPQASRAMDMNIRPGSIVWIPPPDQEARQRGRMKKKGGKKGAPQQKTRAAEGLAASPPELVSPQLTSAPTFPPLLPDICTPVAARALQTPLLPPCVHEAGAAAAAAALAAAAAAAGSQVPRQRRRATVGAAAPDTSAGLLDVLHALGGPVQRRRSAPAPVWGGRGYRRPVRSVFDPPRRRVHGDDLVGGYREHGAAEKGKAVAVRQPARFPEETDCDALLDGLGRLELPTAPPKTGPPGNSLTLGEALSQPDEGETLWPPKQARTSKPVVLRHCSVCGKSGSEGTMDRREHGFKCVGDTAAATCVGRPHNPRLLIDSIPPGYSDKVAQDMVWEGQLGQFGDVVALRECPPKVAGFPPTTQALVNFKAPSAWLPADMVDRLGDHRKLQLDDDAANLPSLYITPDRSAFWERLGAATGFMSIAKAKNSQWVAVRLLEDVAVWLDSDSIIKVGNFTNDFVRVGEVHEVRDAAFTSWEEWWADFALCVGRVLEIRREVRGDEARFLVSVGFEGSAVLSLPAETLRYCTEHAFEAESLLVPQPVVDRIMLSVFVVHPVLMGLKALFLCGYFGYSLFIALSEGHMGSAGNHSGWMAYQELYFRLFNSGYPSLMADFGSVVLYRVNHQDANAAQIVHSLGRPVLVCLFLAISISLPGFVTHCVPMFVYYGWFFLPLFSLLLVAMGRLRAYEPEAPKVEGEHLYNVQHYVEFHRGYLIKAAAFHMAYRFAAETVVVLLLQMSYNYAVLSYGTSGPGGSYLDVIPDEFHLRRIDCILEDAAETKTKLATVLW